MNLSACKKNLETFSGGPVVLNSGREAVKIAEKLLATLEIAQTQLRECGEQIHGQIDKNTAEVLRQIDETFKSIGITE